jgi:hypothetical protein
VTLRRTPIFLATASTLALLTLGVASADAADVVVQPNSGSGLVVTDASGSQIRLRVNEDGEVIIPVLVNGAQRNLPACVSTTGQLGPCAPGAVGGSVGPQGPVGPTGATGPIGATGPQGPAGTGSFTLPYAGSTATPGSAFSVANTAGNNGVHGLNGISGNPSVPASGVWGESTDAVGVLGTSARNSGVQGASTGGSGVLGTSFSGYGVQAISNTGTAFHAESTNGDAVQGFSVSYAGVYGKSTGPKGGAGVLGESAAFDGVHGYTSSPSAVGVAGFADQGTASGVLGVGKAGTGVVGVSTSGFGVFGHSDSNYAFVSDGPAQQNLGQGGWVKAMAYVAPGGGGIVRCFNSQLAASAASVPPCGFGYSRQGAGNTQIDFGFPVGGRFLSATIDGSYRSTISTFSASTTSVAVATHYLDDDKDEDESYYLVVF